MATASDLKAEVETAISKTLEAQSYGIRGRFVNRARLKELMDARRELADEADMESIAGSFLAEQVPAT